MVKVYTWLPRGIRSLEETGFDWIHIYPGAPVPPVMGGSFNHLIWDTLQRHKSHLLIGRYHGQSFVKAKRHDVAVVHIDYKRHYKWLDRVKQRFYNKVVSPDLGFVEAAGNVIAETNCNQLLVWGDIRLVRLFRCEFPTHTIAYAQRFYDESAASFRDYNYADIVLVLSEGIARLTYEKYSEFYPVVLIIPNGVELDVFYPIAAEQKKEVRESLDLPNDKVITLYPSKIHGKKGANYLYRWIEYSQRCIPNLYFLIIGRPTGNTERGYKAKLIDLLEDAPNARWIKTVPRNQMPQYYQLADICLIPSVCREGMTMAALESLASGLPIIATQRGIFPEIVQHGKTGILCRPERFFVDGLRALETLVRRSSLRAEMSANARAYAEKRLSRERCLKNFDAFFRGEWDAIDCELSS